MRTKPDKIDLKVLLVEDDPISDLIAQIRLKQMGVEAVLSVENGLRALNYLNANTPDLILLDINMPTMDGFEFLNALQKYNLCPKTPIVMLTSSARSRDRERAIHYTGIIDYIEKPLTHSKIERVLVTVMLRSGKSFLFHPTSVAL